MSLEGTLGVTNHGPAGGAHNSEVDRMTVVDVLGRVDELADGTGGTADAVRGDGNRSISEIPAKSSSVASGP